MLREEPSRASDHPLQIESRTLRNCSSNGTISAAASTAPNMDSEVQHAKCVTFDATTGMYRTEIFPRVRLAKQIQGVRRRRRLSALHFPLREPMALMLEASIAQHQSEYEGSQF